MFVGTVMALTSISADDRRQRSRAGCLARNGAVTLDTNTINSTVCAIGPTVPDDHRTTHHRRTAPHRIADDRTRWRQHGSGPPDPRPSGRRARSSRDWFADHRGVHDRAFAVALGGALQLLVRLDRRRHDDR